MSLQAVTKQNFTTMWLLAKGTLHGLVSAFSLFGKSPGKKRCLFPLDGHPTHAKSTDWINLNFNQERRFVHPWNSRLERSSVCLQNSPVKKFALLESADINWLRLDSVNITNEVWTVDFHKQRYISWRVKWLNFPCVPWRHKGKWGHSFSHS